MAKRSYDQSGGVEAVKRPRSTSASTGDSASSCQACALQIPTFFCDINCNSLGEYTQKRSSSLAHPDLQTRGGRWHGYDTKTSSPTNSDSESDIPIPSYFEKYSTKLEPKLLSNMDIGFNFVAGSSNGLSLNTEQAENVGFLEEPWFDPSWQHSYQFQNSIKDNPTTLEPIDSLTWPLHDELCRQPGLNPGAETCGSVLDGYFAKKENNEGSAQMGNIVQNLACMDIQFKSYTRQQLETLEHDTVEITSQEPLLPTKLVHHRNYSGQCYNYSSSIPVDHTIPSRRWLTFCSG